MLLYDGVAVGCCGVRLLAGYTTLIYIKSWVAV